MKHLKKLDEILLHSHPNIQCTHNSTIEITKDDYLTLRGNCILGIRANKACSDLNYSLKKEIKKEKQIYVILQIDDHFECFYGYGHRNLTLSSQEDMVFRKSKFICERTALIKCNKASSDLKRNFIEQLQRNPNNEFKMIFYKKSD